MGVGDNVSFHHSNIIRQCFATHNVILIEFLPYSPFLNPIDKFFFLISSIEMESTWSPATYTDDPSGSNGSACHDISADACRSWITEQAHHRYSLWSGWEFVAQQTSTSGHLGRLYCNSYTAECTVFLKEIVLCSYFYLCLFVFALRSAVFSFLYCNYMICQQITVQTVKALMTILSCLLQSISHMHKV